MLLVKGISSATSANQVVKVVDTIHTQIPKYQNKSTVRTVFERLGRYLNGGRLLFVGFKRLNIATRAANTIFLVSLFSKKWVVTKKNEKNQGCRSKVTSFIIISSFS